MGIREAVALVTALGFIAVSSALVAFSGVAVLPRRAPAYLSTQSTFSAASSGSVVWREHSYAPPLPFDMSGKYREVRCAS